MTDNYPSEISWTIEGDDGLYCQSPGYEAIATAHVDPDCCVPDDASFVLTCMDSEGDGFQFGGVHGYIEINGVTYCDENFGTEEVVYVGCINFHSVRNMFIV